MLTDKQILSYKPKAKQYKKSDTEGLSMYINPKGTKVFFFRYKWNDGVKIRWKTIETIRNYN